MNKYIYSAAAFLSLSCIALTSCQNEMEQMGNPAGKEVTLRVSANRGDAATRTTLTPDGGDLACTWNEGDQLLVVQNSNGAKLGVVTIVEGFDTPNGVFEGKVDLTGHDSVSLVYLGTASNAENYEANNLPINLSAQDGTLASLTSQDVLTAEAKVEDNSYLPTGDGVVEVSITMKRQLAFGYFSLDFGGDVTLEAGDVITIAGEGMKSEGKVNFKNAGNVPTATNYSGSTSITVTKADAGNDFYITMLPLGDVTPTFTVVKGGETYTAELGKHNWISGEFVRKNDAGEAVSVEMKKDTGADDTNNPGNLGNWGANADAIAEVATPLSPKFVSETGWVNNIRNLYNMGGYCTAVEMTNGMVNGLLTSKGTTCYYYQWGRFLGFPSNAATGNTTISGAEKLDYYVGYLGSSGVPVKYTAAYMGNSSAYNKQRAIDWSIVFGQTNNDYLDYIYNNANNGSWYDRSPNPAPTGYRIPTMDELSFFIPSTEEVNGSYAEIKVVDGVKYAVKWTVGKVGSRGYVDITSVKTTETSVSATSSIFNSADASSVRIVAYGYMQDDGKLASNGSIGLYWSSDSGEQNAIDGVKGKGGRALYLEVSGTTAYLCELCAPFGFGGNVMLIKDPTATATKIKPWLPYSYDYTAIK
ncbi:MAG: fimbrillin family protein [Muribaculaceae bacterium]|nr:fimbrillin family protein [Muribaculaceae bacterium]